MPKEKTQPLKYNDVVDRLEAVVGQLESGKLSLEESLETFAEGVKLVEAGEDMLKSAERRIEVLLSKDGQTVPFEDTASRPLGKATKKGDEDEEDVSF